MPSSRDIRWRDGEAAAQRVYRERGYRVLAANWRCPLGELDLVLSRGRVVVFCEVKARASPRASPYEAVGWAKQRKVRRLAEAFLASSRLGDAECRFDVASVTFEGRRARVHVFEDAF